MSPPKGGATTDCHAKGYVCVHAIADSQDGPMEEARAVGVWVCLEVKTQKGHTVGPSLYECDAITEVQLSNVTTMG